jgi:hypothetical protein
MNGLVLTAGGARGAYQAGVLKWVGEQPWARGTSPFPILTGASAGAINGAMLACGACELGDATRALAELWEGLRIRDVFRTDLLSVASTAASLARGFALGRLSIRTGTQALLDASPLRRLLERHLPLARISRSIAAGALHALAISATSYRSGRSFTFIQGQADHKVWQRRRRVAIATARARDRRALPRRRGAPVVRGARGRRGGRPALHTAAVADLRRVPERDLPRPPRRRPRPPRAHQRHRARPGERRARGPGRREPRP